MARFSDFKIGDLVLVDWVDGGGSHIPFTGKILAPLEATWQVQSPFGVAMAMSPDMLTLVQTS
jgi:hypothetical protein